MIAMKFTVIEMPSADDVREIAKSAKLERELEEQARVEYREKLKQICMNDMPRLISYINDKIKEFASHGQDWCSIDIDYEENGCEHDERCDFTVKGLISDEFIEKVKEIYRNLGYTVYGHQLCRVHNKCYRDATIQIKW